MDLDSVITSPHRWSQSQTAFLAPSTKRQFSRVGDEFGSCSTLVNRHRFLLTALVLLTFLCTVYLYFAITLGASTANSSLCSGLTGDEKASCHFEQAKAFISKGKLKFF